MPGDDEDVGADRVTAPFLLDLAQCDGVSTDLIGGKALGLARAHAAGFTVPDTVCLTADALAAHLAAAGADPGDSAACLAALEKPLDPSLMDALARACEPFLARGPLAVRSSAPVEDAETASWAGQFSSILGVVTLADLEAAVRECWRSAFEGPATAYAETGGRMALVIQRLVPAVCAGVAFSIDPRTGREGIAVVEAVPGIGSVLVDGRGAPDRFEIDTEGERILEHERGEHHVWVRASDTGVIEEVEPPSVEVDEAAALKAGIIARDLQEFLGCPVDVEWAKGSDDEQVRVLQVRPLTAISFRAVEGVWTTANFVEIIPGTVTALTASMSLTNDYCRALQEFGEQIGLIGADERATDGRRLYGRAYWRVDRIKEALARLPEFCERDFDTGIGIRPTYEGDGRTTGFTFTTIVRGLPVLIRAKRVARREHVSAGEFRRRFLEEVEPAALARDCDAMSDADLAEAVVSALELRWQVNRVALRISFIADMAQDELRAALAKAEHLNPPPSEAALVTGLGDLATGRALRALEALAADLRANPAVTQAILSASEPSDVRAALSAVEGGSEVMARIEQLIDAFGYMADADEELALPRWEEDPSVPFAALQGILRAPEAVTHARANFDSERARVRAAMPRLSRRGFDKKVQAARLFSFWREETREPLSRVNRIVRRVLVAYGRRMAAQGVFAREDDVFRLTRDSLLALARGSLSTQEVTREIRSSRRVEASWANYTAPDVIGVEQAAEVEDSSTEGMRGVACSPGVAEGPVVVVRDLGDLGKVRAGDILVVPFTNPGWTPAFALAAGLVTEEGGLLSHGSIVARERGLPAVLRVSHATERLRDGQRVRVDGTVGVVTVLDE